MKNHPNKTRALLWVVFIIVVLIAGCQDSKPWKHKRMPPGSLFYVHWGYPEGLRRYRVIDTNSNGYFVKYVDGGSWGAIEFMPMDITSQNEFKIIDTTKSKK